MKPVIPNTNESHAVILLGAARVRAHAHATCRAVAEDDISWCDGLDESFAGGPKNCQVTHSIYRRIVARAINGKQSCQSAMSGAPAIDGIDEKAWVSTCDAIVNLTPDSCPFAATSVPGALCRVAAGSIDEDRCAAIGANPDKQWPECCNLFAYRLSQLRSGQTDPRISPESAALVGDASGCDRALTWGLFQDVAQMFGFEQIQQPATDKSGHSDYLCGYVLYWTDEKLPGE
jgi:hypothetical protein